MSSTIHIVYTPGLGQRDLSFANAYVSKVLS